MSNQPASTSSINNHTVYNTSPHILAFKQKLPNKNSQTKNSQSKMVSFTSILASIAATASIISAAPVAQTTCPDACPSTSNDEVLKISNFSSRKYDGKTISSLGFNISATNGGTLNFYCSAYDTVTEKPTIAFDDKRVYFCDKDSSFSFSFTTATSQLYLWQTIVTDT